MDPTYGREYATLYQQHWWWRARERIVLENIGELVLPRNSRILDFGCGDGLLLPALCRYGNVYGLEADAALVSATNPFRDRISTSLLADSPLRQEAFDLITALDVLEHIEQDNEIIDDLFRMLRPGGRLLITVPASMLLWDRHDEINRHYRRYTRTSFLGIVPSNARIVKLRYVFHGLFVLKFAVCLLNRLRRRPIVQHQIPSKWISAVMLQGMLVEYRSLSWMRVPFGTSLLAVLEKPSVAVDGE